MFLNDLIFLQCVSIKKKKKTERIASLGEKKRRQKDCYQVYCLRKSTTRHLYQTCFQVEKKLAFKLKN